VEKVRYAVVGIGNMGFVHATQIFDGNVENAVLSALCDVSEEKLKNAKEKFGDSVSYYTDYKELLMSKQVDAIIVATPHYMHPVIAVDAMKAGIPVLWEKPAGVRVSDVKRMNLVAKVSRVKFGIMLNQRMNPVFSTLKYYIDLGVLGDIKHFTWTVNNWYRTQHYYDSAGWRATWKGEGGGVLINQAPHNLDIWQWIMGMPESIRAFCQEGKFHNISVEDDATIYAAYKNGATAVFMTSTGEYPGTNRLEINGTMGKAVCEEGVIKLYLLKEDEREIRVHSSKDMPLEPVTNIEIKCKPLKEEHLMIIQNFTNHILFDEPLVAPGEEGVNSLTISNAAYLSSWKNRTIKLPASERDFNRALKKKRDIRRGNKENSSEHPAGTEYSERWKVRW